MKLYMVPLAPNPTKVMLYIAERAELGCDMKIEQIVVNTVMGRHKEPAHLARNPFGTVPTLELDDGSFIVESLAIIEYLEELYPDPPMIGTDPFSRARQRELERLADLRMLLPIAYCVHGTRSPLGWPPNPGLTEFGRKGLEIGLSSFESILSDGRPFVCGERPSVADCTLAAGLQFARFGKLELPGEHPNLERWDRSYRERPAARSVLVL